MRELLQIGLGNALTAAVLAGAVVVVTRWWRQPQIAWWLWALVLAKAAAPPWCAFPVRLDARPDSAMTAVVATQSLAETYAAANVAEDGPPGTAIRPSPRSQGVDVAALPPSWNRAGVGRWAALAEILTLMLWLGGAMVLALILVLRVTRFHRLVRQTPLADEALQQTTAACAQRLGLRQIPEVRVTPGRVAPLVWGVGRRARVLLPAALLPRLSQPQLEALLTHELVHLRRRDHWVRWFETFLVLAAWWSPVSWWARRKLQQAEEECCDALVLQTLPQHARAYAAALWETVNYLSEGPTVAPFAASGFGRVNLLKRRFEMILQGSQRRLSWKGRAMLALMAVAVIPFSAYAVWGEEDGDNASPSLIQRIERLEQLVEKLLTRDDDTPDQLTPERQETLKSSRVVRADSAGKPDSKPAPDPIQAALEQNVTCDFENEPLKDALSNLAKQANINLVLNAQAIKEEGVTQHHSVTLQVLQPAKLKTCLELILEPLQLTYGVRNDVLEITSRRVQRGMMLTKVYNVADLVVPIPGLSDESGNSKLRFEDWSIAQQRAIVAPSPEPAAPPEPVNTQAGLATLIRTITTTVAPQTWDETGGPGAIQPFAGNLSLVVSQTADIHEQIAELLEQMRRLQEVQIVIEARFLSVPPDYMENVVGNLDQTVRKLRTTTLVGEDGVERIGVDFDFDVQESPAAVSPAAFLAERKYAVIKESQVREMVVTAQAHERANILAAPKVTIFNGQRAFFSMGSVVPQATKRRDWFSLRKSRPTTFTHDGVSLAMQGVVTPDRKAVRLSLAPRVGNSTVAAEAVPGEALPAPQDWAKLGGTFTATVPVGDALLIDGGDLKEASPTHADSEGQRLLLLVTPRTVLVGDQEEPRALPAPTDADR